MTHPRTIMAWSWVAAAVVGMLVAWAAIQWLWNHPWIPVTALFIIAVAVVTHHELKRREGSV